MDPNRRSPAMQKSGKVRVSADSVVARWQLVAPRGML